MLITIAKFFHFMSLIIWIGTITFFSFFGAPSIFKVLDRDLAGDVVGDIFPKYWMIGYICSPIALGTLLFLQKSSTVNTTGRVVILAIMLIIVYCSGLVVGAKAKSVKAEMRATEDVKKKELIQKHFMKIHGISMMMNLTVFILGVVVIFMTAYYVKM